MSSGTTVEKHIGLWWGLKPAEIIAMLAGASLVLAAAHSRLWTVPVVEAWAFATGGVCVWLVVRQHMANWPVGLANNILFFILFLESRLYADMSLQVIYFGLGVFGWWNWLFGGQNHSRLTITRTTSREWLALAILTAAVTWILREILVAVNGSAPFWDAFTTVLSLVAQYLLCRKRLEHWFVWIAADIIFIPLYLSRGLHLTALLYAVFLSMCLFGLHAWTKHWKDSRA